MPESYPLVWTWMLLALSALFVGVFVSATWAHGTVFEFQQGLCVVMLGVLYSVWKRTVPARPR